MTGLELTVERSYQTHSHNVHCKITGLVIRSSGRRNISSSRIHCCYVILSTEFKLSCFVVQSSALGLKKKNVLWIKQTNTFVLLSSLRTPDPYLLFENTRCSLLFGDPGLLSTYLEIDSLNVLVCFYIIHVKLHTWFLTYERLIYTPPASPQACNVCLFNKAVGKERVEGYKWVRDNSTSMF